MDRPLFIFALGVFLCYALFPLWVSGTTPRPPGRGDLRRLRYAPSLAGFPMSKRRSANDGVPDRPLSLRSQFSPWRVGMSQQEIGRRPAVNAGASPPASAGMPVEATGGFGPVVKAGPFVAIGFAHFAFGATPALHVFGKQ
jgi:hypothetical protein